MTEKIKILLTNDDGISATGIKVLENILADIGYTNIFIVAPLRDQSGAGASFSYTRPVGLEYLSLSDSGTQSWAVDGTPVDCIKLALSVLLKNNLPDLVLSGINNGSNAGRNTLYSGTVNAALEARLKGVPAIALSQISKIEYLNPKKVAKYLKVLIEYILKHSLPEHYILNINLPQIAIEEEFSGIKFSEQGKEIISEDPRYMGVIKNKNYYALGSLISENPYYRSEEFQLLYEKYITAVLISTFSAFPQNSKETIDTIKKQFDDFCSTHFESLVNQN